MCVVDDFYFWYCVEGVIVCHEGNYALAEVTDLDADIPQEIAACPSPTIMLVSGYTLTRKSSMANHDLTEWVPTSSCENTNLYLPKEM